jgi:hypothetical protein
VCEHCGGREELDVVQRVAVGEDGLEEFALNASGGENLLQIGKLHPGAWRGKGVEGRQVSLQAG